MVINHILLKSSCWFCILIFSCGENKQVNNELTYWSANNPEEMEFAENRIKIWNNENREFPIHFQPVPEGSSSEEIILASVVGKTTPDIYANMWQGDFEDYALGAFLLAGSEIYQLSQELRTL